jgi:hypothetical protein
MAIFRVVGFSVNIFWLCSNTLSPASKNSRAAIQISCGHSFSIQRFLKNSLFSGIRHTLCPVLVYLWILDESPNRSFVFFSFSQLGLGTEFRSEKLVSVILQKKTLIMRHSEFRGRANFEAWSGTVRNIITVNPNLHTHALTLKSNSAKYYLFYEKSRFLHTFLKFCRESRKI